MNALVLDMPDDPAAQAPWLDRRLVGADLAALVAELDAIHGRAQPVTLSPPALDTIVAGHRRALLDRGLAALPPHELGILLRHPRLLLELQELVLLQGGAYWQELNRADPELARGVAAVWSRIAAHVRLPGAERRADSRPQPSPHAEGRGSYANRLVLVWASLATIAATVLILLHAGQPSPWGWNRPGVLVRSESELPGAYLNRLADLADEWFDEKPASDDDLARRLGALRADCTRLIVANLGRLPAAERTWLVERCRNWAGRLDQAIHDLEKGEPPDRVRAEVDAIINPMIKTLREHARSIS